MYRDGMTNYRNGMASYRDGMTNYRNGTASYRDGMTNYRNGTASYRDGMANYRNGTASCHDGMANYLTVWQVTVSVHQQNSLFWLQGPQLPPLSTILYSLDRQVTSGQPCRILATGPTALTLVHNSVQSDSFTDF